MAISLLLGLLVRSVLVQLAQLYATTKFRKLPGPKTNCLFGNTLQLSSQPDGNDIYYFIVCTSMLRFYLKVTSL